MSDIAIKVVDLSKKYNLGSINSGSFSEDLRKGWAKINGKKDPTLKIGTDQFQKEYWALKDVGFEIKEGESVGIIGKNGAGKSTLLKVLSRVTIPTYGNVKIRGRIASLLEVGTGFHPDLSGKENIFMNGAILGMSRFEIRKKLEEIIEFSGVQNYIETPVKRYSSGMYVRLAFAVAAHLEPEILIIDEVLAVGDAEFQKKCLGKMSEVAGAGRTVLFVSHNLGAVAELCTRSLVLSKGKLVYSGDVNTAISKYTQLNSGTLQENGSYVAHLEASSQKEYFIQSARVQDSKGFVKDTFLFDESIHLVMLLKSNSGKIDTTLSVSLVNKNQSKVFTVHKHFETSQGEMEVIMKLPASLFAPNLYSFDLANIIHNKITYDLVEGICPIKIIDNGTENAMLEGLDYGSVLIKPEWN